MSSPLVRHGAIAVCLCIMGTRLAAQRTLPDIPYVPGGGASQQLDLYLPQNSGFPTLILVHGGGLTQEDKRDDSLPEICATVARQGVGCASVNYRLGPGTRWPAQPADVAAAIAWLRHHVAEYHGDSTRLVLLGHSSGCLLAGLVGTDPTYLADQGLPLQALSGVVAMGCTLSPVPPAIRDSTRLRAIFTTGELSTFGSLEAFLAADPTARVGPLTPPFLVLVAESEQENPPVLSRARLFASAMQAVSRPVAIEVLPRRRHYTALKCMAAAEDPTLALVLTFIRRVTAP